MADEVVGSERSKIKVRMGDIEIEYEGAHNYLLSDLPALVQSLLDLRTAVGDSDSVTGPGDGGNGNGGTSGGTIRLATVAAIAGEIGGKSCAQLAVAACAKLGLVDGKDRYSRDDILQAMKTAGGGLYKQSFKGSNLTSALTGLVNAKRLNVPAAGYYALHADEAAKLKAQLA